MVAWIGPAIAAGASLAGGLMNKNATEKANAANLAAQREHTDRQVQLQKKFAQEGIRWRVEDAKKAGIHPLYALGASTPSYTPSAAAFNQAPASMGSSLAAAGQDIGRAMNATRTAPERADAYTETLRGLQLKNAELDLEIKKTDLASRVARLGQNSNPPMADGLSSDGMLPLDKWDKATPLLTGGKPVTTDRRWSDGQTFEDRWGEWGGSLAGLAVMAADILNTNSLTAAALRNKYPVNFSARGSFRENSNLVGRR